MASVQERRAHFKRHPSEIHLRELANDIGCENERLGSQLGFKKPELDKFKANYRNFEDRIFYMLVNWKQKNYAIPDLFEELVNALTKVDRRDLASKVEDWKGKPNYKSRDIVDEEDAPGTEAPGNQASPRPTLQRAISKIEDTDKEFRFLASKIGEEWQKFATFLGLKTQDVYRIKLNCSNEEDRVFTVMVKWQQNMAPHTNMVKTLAKALEESGRCDLKEELLAKYATTKEPIEEPTKEEVEKNLLHEYNLPPFLGEIEVAYKKVDTPSIPFDLYIDLCIALDPVDPSGNDWRMLAARLQLSRYINYLKTHYKDGPTSCVLLCWMKQKESMDKLADILEEIKRGDAASLIRNYGIKEEDKEQ